MYTGIQPTHHGLALRHEPGHHIGNLLRRQRLAWDVGAPVRHPKVYSASNHRCPQGLIAYQGEISRIHNRSALRSPRAVGAVAARTGLGIPPQAALGIPGL